MAPSPHRGTTVEVRDLSTLAVQVPRSSARSRPDRWLAERIALRGSTQRSALVTAAHAGRARPASTIAADRALRPCWVMISCAAMKLITGVRHAPARLVLPATHAQSQPDQQYFFLDDVCCAEAFRERSSPRTATKVSGRHAVMLYLEMNFARVDVSAHP
jgi:hypothetical protein